jgi:competence protein ComEC
LSLRVVARHPRHSVLASLVAGLLLAPVSSPLVPLAAACAVVVCARRPAVALLAATAALGGGGIATARLHALDRTALRDELGHTLTLRAVLLEAPRTGSFHTRSALARIASGRGAGERVVVRGPERGGWARLAIGDEVSARGALKPLGPFDAFQRRRGAHAVLSATTLRPSGVRRGGVAGGLDRVRARAETALAVAIPRRESALFRGMVLGQDYALTDGVREDFRASGLAHLVAASGQNVMLLVALAALLGGLLGVSLRARLAVALALVVLYVPVAGAGPSIQRAGVMAAAGVVAALAGRLPSRVYALLLAAAATLVLNPRSAGDPGWQLSFAAVASIMLAARPVAVRLRERRVSGPAADAIGVTAAATVGTAPLIAFHFGRLSLVSLPANVLAAAAVAPIVWLGTVAGAVGQVAPGLAAVPNLLAVCPLAFVEWVAHASARLPHATLPLTIGSPLAVAGAYAAMVVLFRSRRARRIAAVLGLAATLAIATTARTAPTSRGVVVSFLDVGQGDATLLQDGEHAILVDAGPPGSPLLDQLRQAGVRRLDALVVTHAQLDHEGGAPAVLDAYRVGMLVDGRDDVHSREADAVGDAAARHHVRLVRPEPGEVVRAGRLALHVLWPRPELPSMHAGEDPNTRAIVALARVGALRVLLPADAESDVTAALDLPPVDVLKVAHHGSTDPGLPELVDRLQPRVAVIEVGQHNPYGHPTPQALRALRTVPRVYRTDRDGTVRIVPTAGGMAVTAGT